MQRSHALVLLCALLSVPPSLADEVVKVSDEFQVNTYTTYYQYDPRVAMDPGGNFLVVWNGVGDTDFFGVFGQLYAADGTAVGTEFQIDTNTTSYQFSPAVAADGLGSFVVTWDSCFNQDGDGCGIFGQRLDSSGGPIGGEFQVNTYTTGYQVYSAVAAAADGSFLVVWHTLSNDFAFSDVFGQLFDSVGAEVGGEFQVNTASFGYQGEAEVAAAAGGFVVTWEGHLADGNNQGIVMQMLDAGAGFVGGETVVNSFTFGDQEEPAIAAAADGTFAITWEDEAQEGDGDAVYGQVFDSSGMPVGAEFRLNSYTTNDQFNPRVAADGAGGFVAVWQSVGQVDGTDADDVFGQRFDSSGQLLGGEFQVNTQASYYQGFPDIAGGVDGRFVVAWESYPDFDGDSAGVFAQRFDLALFADGFEDGDTLAWSVTLP